MFCEFCDTNKSIENFSWRNKSLGKRHKRCKSCHQSYAKEHYSDNIQYYKEKGHRSRVKIKRSNRAFILNYLKRNPCADCPEKDIRCLQFDHVYGKTTNIGKLEGCSLETLKEEISLCEVRCANCHMKRTGSMYGWRAEVA